MSKQIVKNLSMLALVVGLALAAGVQSTNAQTSHRVTAMIPFDFIVGEKTLPAGRYLVSSATSDSSGLKIQNQEGKSVAFRLSNPLTERNQNPKVRMVFHRYGQQYFLTQVWSGDGDGRELRRSKLESKVRQELASNTPKIDSPKDNYQVVEVVAMLR
jgi:hypothetical protein